MEYRVNHTEVTIEPRDANNHVVESTNIPVLIRAALYLIGYFNIFQIRRRELCSRCWSIRNEAKQFSNATAAEILLGLDEPQREETPRQDDQIVESRHSSTIALSPLPSSNHCHFRETHCYECEVQDSASTLTRPGQCQGDVKSRCARIKDCLSWVWILFVFLLMVYNLVRHLVLRYGKKEKALHLVSYGLYTIILIVALLLRVLSLPGLGRIKALTEAFILGRLQYADLRRPAKQTLIFFLFPILCTLARIISNLYDYVQEPSSPCESKPRASVKDVFGPLGGILAYFTFSSFCYVLFLLRKAIEREVCLLTSYVNSNTDNIEVCFKKTLVCFRNFSALQLIVCRWMVSQMSLAVLKFVIQVYWNYSLEEEDRLKAEALLLATVIWLEISMFVVLPAVAVGGFHIEYIWRKFSSFVKIASTVKRSPFWDRFSAFVAEIQPHKMAGKMAFILAIVTGILAVNLGIQYVAFWADGDSSCANSTISLDLADNDTFFATSGLDIFQNAADNLTTAAPELISPQLDSSPMLVTMVTATKRLTNVTEGITVTAVTNA